jgi:NitT/TauT family transport system substrate-binding protein
LIPRKSEENLMKTLLRSTVAAALALAALPALAAAPEKPSLSVGVGSSILNYVPLPLAQGLGLFKEQGLNVTIENFQSGGSKALQALIGGSADAVVGFYDHTITMQAQGKEIVGVVLLNDQPGVVFGVRSDLADKVKTAKDLKGMKIGITAPGSSTDTIARYYLSRNGLGPRDVGYLAVGSGSPGMVALENKNVDALVYFDPVATLLQRKGLATPLFDARTSEGSKIAFGGDYPTACLYVSRAFLDKNPETVQRLVNAFVKTLRWIDEKPAEEIVDAIPAASKVDDRALNLEVITASKRMFSKTGLFKPGALEVPLAVLASYDEKIAGAKIDLAKTFTNRFVEAAGK